MLPAKHITACLSGAAQELNLHSAEADYTFVGMAELTMRQLEGDSAKEQSNAKGLLRPKAAYEAAMMLVDASQHAWKVLYLDSQASSVTGTLPRTFPLRGSIPAGMHCAQPSCTYAAAAMLPPNADAYCPGKIPSVLTVMACGSASPHGVRPL